MYLDRHLTENGKNVGPSQVSLPSAKLDMMNQGIITIDTK